MKTDILLSTVAISLLSYGVSVQAVIPPSTAVTPVAQNQFETVAFSDSAEAGMMHRAYHILATGDHDYKGHRIAAMHQIEAAAKLLGLDLSGDLKDKEKQVLSDDKLREAQGLLQNVLGNAEVKGQPRVAKHINGAINQISTALSVR
jgi:hypothetical protein